MAVHNVTVEKTILALLEEKKYQTLKDILVTMNPADIAAVFEELDEERIPLLFRLLPKETAAERRIRCLILYLRHDGRTARPPGCRVAILLFTIFPELWLFWFFQNV